MESHLFRVNKFVISGFALGISVIVLAALNSKVAGDPFEPKLEVSQEALDLTVDLGEPRPTLLYLPQEYDGSSKVPLLINLHGYSGNGSSQSAYTRLQEVAFNNGIAYVAPDGLADNLGNNYWNATTACCDFNKSKVDDVEYIDSLIKRAQESAKIDSKRIYLFGHSNGHFMAYAYLCNGKRNVAAVAGLAGAMEPDLSKCKAKQSNILHIHGLLDQTILYEGGSLFGNPYSSVASTIDQWSAINGCANETKTESDQLTSIPGPDSEVSSFDCTKGSLELWSMPQGVHTPSLDLGFAQRVLDWLLSKSL